MQINPQVAQTLKNTAREAASLASKLPEHVEGEVLVKLQDGVQIADHVASDYGAEVATRFEFPAVMQSKMGGQLVKLKLPEGMSTAEAMAALGKDDRVAYAASNDIRRAFGAPIVPNDLDPRLWGLNNTGQDNGTAGADIQAPKAWSITTGSRTGPIIAVVDTGVDYNHPDLAANAWVNAGEIPGNGIDDDGNGVVDDVHGFNAINDSGDPMDDNSHGSHCSGTIGGEGNNGQGVVGVNWQARIMGAKFLSGSGGGSVEDQIKALAYATANGARITSNSYGGGGFNQAEYDVLAASPALHICAAGNESSDNDGSNPSYPASYDLPNIISVAASDRNDQLARFSNYGATSVDIAAPGVDILSTTPGGNYRSFSGTSMATPHVAGVAGLIATAYPDATNEQIRSRLLGGADTLAQLSGKVAGAGRLNAANALENDQLAPAAPNDLSAASAQANGVTLQWTATGDDGWCGRASGYDLRVSEQPFSDQSSFEQAAQVATGAPSATGSIENARITVLPSSSERTLHVGLKVRDNVGNLSALKTIEVTVPAAAVAFEDNMDAASDNWTAEGSWGQAEEPGRGLVFTDSPAGNYGDNQNISLTSRAISLESLNGSTLLFDASYDLENRYDKVHVEVSEDGQNWNGLKQFTGSGGWATHQADLSAYDGKSVQLRFRLESDGSVAKDGFKLDKLVIAGSPR